MKDKKDIEAPETENSKARKGPLSDIRPEHGNDPRTGGGMNQQDVSSRPNVSTVKPSDYPDQA